ncbi:MAG: hypothetical protein KDN20_17955 [Verrucomicrobiae bacterium]|nr:hypothetical protein [Verrucomicrobiae bacterium]
MRSTRDWIATDLDGTLFAREWAGEDSVPGTWKCGEDAAATQVPSSWIPGPHYRLVSTLALHFDIVPVTARDLASFQRVSIDGIPMEGVAVLSNGGLVLNSEGKVDEEWFDLASEICKPWVDQLLELYGWLLQQEIGSLKTRMIEGARGLPAYVVAKASFDWWKTTEAKELLAQVSKKSPLIVSKYKNELQVLTPALNKKTATEFVIKKYYSGNAPVLCLGDMPADIDFMRLAAFMVTPRDSSITHEKLIKDDSSRY